MHTGSVLDTELLLGEAVVLSGQTTDSGFVHITALHDGYQGWVKLADLAKQPKPFTANAKICQPFAVLTAGPDVKSACLQQLPFGAAVMITGPAERGFVPLWGWAAMEGNRLASFLRHIFSPPVNRAMRIGQAGQRNLLVLPINGADAVRLDLIAQLLSN